MSETPRGIPRLDEQQMTDWRRRNIERQPISETPRCPACDAAMSLSPVIGGPMLCPDPRCRIAAQRRAAFTESLSDRIKRGIEG